jgi:hypothetical protein
MATAQANGRSHGFTSMPELLQFSNSLTSIHRIYMFLLHKPTNYPIDMIERKYVID